MAVPCPLMYYYLGQLQHFTGCDLERVADASKGLLLGPDSIYTALSHMEMVFPRVPTKCPTVQLLMKVWKGVRTTLGLTGYFRETPIWQIHFYTDLTKVLKHTIWEGEGIRFLTQTLNGSVLKPYPQLQWEFPGLKSHHFQYMQLKHSIHSQGRH